MASSRLPGKVVLPLDGTPAIKHVIRRAKVASNVDGIIVATTFHNRDGLIAQYASDEGADVYRGSEDDVLGRLCGASEAADGDAVIRLTGDNPLVAPELIDTVADVVLDRGVDYASNKIERTFPLGVDAEALTITSLREIHAETRDPYHREHATKFYREYDDRFDTANVTVTDVYGEPIDEFSPAIRLTLDEVPDYKLFSRLYEDIEYDKIVDVQKAVQYLIQNDLGEVNEHIEQKTL